MPEDNGKQNAEKSYTTKYQKHIAKYQKHICDNDYVDNDVQDRDDCYITGKYKSSAHRNCNINVQLNHKFLPYFTTYKIMIRILLYKN